MKDNIINKKVIEIFPVKSEKNQSAILGNSTWCLQKTPPYKNLSLGTFLMFNLAPERSRFELFHLNAIKDGKVICSTNDNMKVDIMPMYLVKHFIINQFNNGYYFVDECGHLNYTCGETIQKVIHKWSQS